MAGLETFLTFEEFIAHWAEDRPERIALLGADPEALGEREGADPAVHAEGIGARRAIVVVYFGGNAWRVVALEEGREDIGRFLRVRDGYEVVGVDHHELAARDAVVVIFGSKVGDEDVAPAVKDERGCATFADALHDGGERSLIGIPELAEPGGARLEGA